jgi:hypothetical protein
MDAKISPGKSAVSNSGPENEYRVSVKRLIENEVASIIDEEIGIAERELAEEQKKAVNELVEEYKLVIRKVVEEEKKALYLKVSELRQSIIRLGSNRIKPNTD